MKGDLMHSTGKVNLGKVDIEKQQYTSEQQLPNPHNPIPVPHNPNPNNPIPIPHNPNPNNPIPIPHSPQSHKK